MCPEKERLLRIERNLLAAFEMNEYKKAIQPMMIKEYSRSSADRKEDLRHDLRPPKVLRITMDFLLSTTLQQIDWSRVAEWYDFAWNRTRAIRKEISIQEASDEVSIEVVEECAR